MLYERAGYLRAQFQFAALCVTPPPPSGRFLPLGVPTGEFGIVWCVVA